RHARGLQGRGEQGSGGHPPAARRPHQRDAGPARVRAPHRRPDTRAEGRQLRHRGRAPEGPENRAHLLCPRRARRVPRRRQGVLEPLHTGSPPAGVATPPYVAQPPTASAPLAARATIDPPWGWVTEDAERALGYARASM